MTKALDLGIRQFDTAPHYGLGLAEERLGVGLAKALKALPDADAAAVKVWTKAGRVVKA